ncbi:hypothetical protein [Streptomyces sp. NPDC088752]|uniref:hypothetical protein n=1 Tax=Streptomyces sp. NPDC088752 TaxID=3154963 RepID=UPI003422B3B3
MTESLRQRDGDQPLPVEGQENVQDRLIEKIKERRELGIQRYGRPLQTFNGRDAVKDALEEALDLATYLMQVGMEIAATRLRIHDALRLHASSSDNKCTTCRTASPCATRRILVEVTPTDSQPEWPYHITDPVLAVHYAVEGPDCPWNRPESCSYHESARKVISAYDTWRATRP